MWSTHQFWIGFFGALGIDPKRIVFSSDTSEEQGRRYGRGRCTVDCCYPVKCMSGHYGELIFADRHKIDVLFSPMIRSLPSYLGPHVDDSLSCPRVMAGPENIRAGFMKMADQFKERGIALVAPLVCLAEPRLVPKQLHTALAPVLPGLSYDEVGAAVNAGYVALDAFNAEARARSRSILDACAAENRPCILVLARPYHMDPGIGHDIEGDLQAYGYPILWGQHLPIDADIMDWLLGEDVRAGRIPSPLSVRDVWTSSYSANTNEILWGAKVGARLPWVTCVVRISSYECGMDQPTYTPVQRIVEGTGTMFFSFQDLDATKPSGSIKIRIETIAHYIARHSDRIMADKLARRGGKNPFGTPYARKSTADGARHTGACTEPSFASSIERRASAAAK